MSGDEVIETNAVSVSSSGHSLSIGDCVEVEKERRFGTADSEGGAGFVTAGLNQDGTFNVRWVLSNRGEQNVRSSRLKSNNPLALSARRTSANYRATIDIVSFTLSAGSHVKYIIGFESKSSIQTCRVGWTERCCCNHFSEQTVVKI